MKKILWIVFAIAIFAALLSMSHEVSADTHQWIGTTNDASVASNWKDSAGAAVVPVNGDAIIYNANALGACNLNIAVSFDSIWLQSNNTRAVTLSGALSVVDITVDAGTLTGSTTTIPCSGSFMRNAGTVSDATLRMNFTGTGKTIKLASASFLHLYISGTVTAATQIAAYQFGVSGAFHLDTNKLDVYGGYTGYNNPYISGTIDGTGIVTFIFGNSDRDISCIGSILNPVTFNAAAGALTDRVCKLLTPSTFGTTTISSGHATYTMTLDTNGMNTAVSGIVVGTKGVLLGKTGIITNSGSWDTSLGTWTPATSTVNEADTNKTIKLAAGQAFNKLNIVCSGNDASWIIEGVSGNVCWNVTGLEPSRAYNYRLSYSLQSPLTADGAGVIAFNRSTWSTHTYDLRLIPFITALPISSPDYSRHSIAESTTYYANYTSDQTVTWTLSTTASWLSWNGSSLSGTVGDDDQGTYYANLTASNVNGDTTMQTFVIVADTQMAGSNALSDMAIGLIVLLSVISLLGVFAYIKW